MMRAAVRGEGMKMRRETTPGDAFDGQEATSPQGMRGSLGFEIRRGLPVSEGPFFAAYGKDSHP